MSTHEQRLCKVHDAIDLSCHSAVYTTVQTTLVCGAVNKLVIIVVYDQEVSCISKRSSSANHNEDLRSHNPGQIGCAGQVSSADCDQFFSPELIF